MEKLYRIISLEAFLAILLNEEDRLVRPIDCWEDTYEGYLFRMIEQQGEKCREVIDRLYNHVSNKMAYETITNLAKLIRCRYTCYCMCWSTEDDSDALWRIYSYDKKAIQLVSSKERICKTIADAHYDEDNYCIKKMQYDNKDDILSLSRIFEPDSKIHDTFLHKRSAFAHEKEVRVILHYVFDWDIREDHIKDNILEQFEQSKANNNVDKIVDALKNVNFKNIYDVAKNYNSRNLKIKDIKQYLEGVRTHPQAPDWYQEVVHKLCLEYNVTYLGQSKLYKQIQ